MKKEPPRADRRQAIPFAGSLERISDFTNYPLISGLIGLLVIAGVFLATARPLADVDIWWHLKTGLWIEKTGIIPRTDIFSYVISGKPWITFEWLSQLFFYKIWKAWGALGLFAFREGMGCALFAVLFALGWRVSLGTAAVLLTSLAVVSPSILERPQLFTYLFALLYRIAIPVYRDSKRPYAVGAAILFVQVLWANLHGGASVVGLLIMGIYGAAFLWRKEFVYAQRIAALAVLAFLAALLNPHGYRIYTHLVATWFDPAQRWVLEWKPMVPGSPQFYVYGAYLAVLAWSCFKLQGNRRTAAVLFGAVFGGFFALRSVRNVPIAFFITCPDIIAAIAALYRGRKDLYAASMLPAAVIAALVFRPLGAFVHPEGPSRGSLTSEWLQGACDFILKHNMRGHMYNDYVIGGYLIWRLAPERQVFMDGRSLEYGARLMHLIARVSRREGFDDLDALYRFDYAVFQQRQDARLSYMDDHPYWRCVYFDDGGLIYAHKARADARVAANFSYKYLRPNEQTFDYLRQYAVNPQRAARVRKELDRAIKETPPALAVNIHLTKSAFLLMSAGELAWARWMIDSGRRFDYPEWQRQIAAANEILFRLKRMPRN